MCPEEHTCIQGFGKSPDYDYTNFDSFNWALLSAFRLMTQDAWEQLYQQVLRASGSAHILFFVAAIFLGSIYLVNLILAIVAMSYDELSKKAQDEAEAAALEESNFQESQRNAEADLAERRRSSRCVRSPEPSEYSHLSPTREKERRALRSDDGFAQRVAGAVSKVRPIFLLATFRPISRRVRVATLSWCLPCSKRSPSAFTASSIVLK